MINNRRRFLKIMALSGGFACAPNFVLAGEKSYRWTGRALGAESSIELFADSKQEADTVLENAVALIVYYERLFNLHDSHSEVSQLNRDGVLNNPSDEFSDLVNISKEFYEQSNGAFDVTIQPLWDLYKSHFNDKDQGDLEAQLKSILPLIGSEKILMQEQAISFEKRGMAISFNGIAQGFITDKVTEYLKSEGYNNILVDLGEYSAGGPQANGSPWRIGILNPFDAVSIADVIEMDSGAIATSGGYGNQFDYDGKHHHLFNPKTGLSSQKYASVSVKAKDATTADALSTAFSNMNIDDVQRVARIYDVEHVHIINHDRQITRIS